MDIYKGQIAAILGHSGAGEPKQLNVLSGLCISTKGKRFSSTLISESSVPLLLL
jgi:energy-coupling factor transporter ATP-binding protein EcfA2